MMMGGAQVSLAAAVVLAAGPAWAGQADPGTKLCLYPVRVPLGEKAGEERRRAIEQRLIAALRVASFDVADPTAVRALRTRVFDEEQRLYDPATGERDRAAFEAARARLAAALASELGCAAQLDAMVAVVRARFDNHKASWDGTSQEIVVSTGRVLANAFVGVHGESGWIRAFSLWLRVSDLRGEPLAFRSVGIETPLQLNVNGFDLAPEDRWLRDAARIATAIRSAVGQIGWELRRDLRFGAAASMKSKP